MFRVRVSIRCSVWLGSGYAQVLHSLPLSLSLSHCLHGTIYHHHHHHRIASVGRRVARPWWPRPRACLHRSADVWLVSFRIWSIQLSRGRPGRRLQEGWGRRPSEILTWDCRALCAGVLSCSLARGQRRRCDDVGWRRWWQVDQWAQIFRSCERIASTRFSGFCVGISCGMPPGTWHLLKWEFMSRRHRVGRTGREQGKRVFWWKGVLYIAHVNEHFRRLLLTNH